MEDNITTPEEQLSPQQYFEVVKDRKNQITDEQLQLVYENCLELINKYVITGQTKAIKKLMFHLDCIEKEREIVKLGVNTFVYRDDIEYYINNVASDVVKIIDLKSYEREIPDEIVNTVSKVKDIFDEFYVVFTDYTGATERQVEKERRERDPILFGTFQNKDTRSVIDRFYYLGDWVDEFCDLTLDKMVNETNKIGRHITRTISTPQDIAELREQLNNLHDTSINITTNTFIATPDAEKKKSFFSKIKSLFKKQ